MAGDYVIGYSIERFELDLQTVLDGIERRFLDQPG
jgi:hypothetical protein